MLIKKCLVCDKKFTKPISCGMPEWTNKRKFCSKECSNIYKIGKPNLSSTKFKKGQKAINPIKKGQQLSPNTQFKKRNKPWNKGKKMSAEMYNKLKNAGFFESKFGKYSGNWKGGVTKTSSVIRTMREYKAWRKSIFRRDDYTCQKCENLSRRLQVHHIKPFYKIIEKNNIRSPNDARNCKELLDMDNGQTLCLACHRQTDTYLVNQYTK